MEKKSDQAHTPIHLTKFTNSLQGLFLFIIKLIVLISATGHLHCTLTLYLQLFYIYILQLYTFINYVYMYVLYT